ncbi:MAG: tRNA (cytidine(34)-2'-O)-methyltransferase [Planctomycetota bacterium]|nr:tRNA (cytidine(34)-2'-O)-methyltransferase [Planctomycetota bacterium]
MREPEIPNNTGNIGRTCLASGCALHLVHPLGFDTSEKALRRAGLDYWPRLEVREHADWARFERWWAEWCGGERGAARGPILWLTSGKRGAPPWEADLRPGDGIVFGRETRGLPDEDLEAAGERVLSLPMIPAERGLNVATAVCALVYEGIRQCAARGDVGLDASGRLRLV